MPDLDLSASPLLRYAISQTFGGSNVEVYAASDNRQLAFIEVRFDERYWEMRAFGPEGPVICQQRLPGGAPSDGIDLINGAMVLSADFAWVVEDLFRRWLA
jgi:hypothetical protein